MYYNILHIAPHYGGGIGSTVYAWTETDTYNNHILSYLSDVPENEHKREQLFQMRMLRDCDIAVCHVWNHPELFKFLVNARLPPCRLIGWSHMAGLYPPYILFDKLINYFDEFYYSSPVSNLSGIKKEFIWSTRDIQEFLNIEKKPHEGFNIGYIGTLDFSKMHPEFINICSRINISDVKFTVIGHGCHEDLLKKQAKEKNLNMTFTGKIKDVKPYLSEFDLFLYPLNEKHYGTCEQVIGEAVASDVPCIVLNNPAESYIIKYVQNGSIALNIDNMVNIINSGFAQKSLSDEGKHYAQKLYSINLKINKWNRVFDNIIKQDKKQKFWGSNNHPFIESLGEYGSFFKENNIEKIKELFNSNYWQWQSETKGSLKHYLKFFPNDKNLQEWNKLLK